MGGERGTSVWGGRPPLTTRSWNLSSKAKLDQAHPKKEKKAMLGWERSQGEVFISKFKKSPLGKTRVQTRSI